MAKNLTDLMGEIALPRRWPRRLWFTAAFIATFGAGVLLGNARHEARFEAIESRLRTWHESYERDYKLHHSLKPVTKAAAQVSAAKREEP